MNGKVTLNRMDNVIVDALSEGLHSVLKDVKPGTLTAKKINNICKYCFNQIQVVPNDERINKREDFGVSLSLTELFNCYDTAGDEPIEKEPEWDQDAVHKALTRVIQDKKKRKLNE